MHYFLELGKHFRKREEKNWENKYQDSSLVCHHHHSLLSLGRVIINRMEGKKQKERKVLLPIEKQRQWSKEGRKRLKVSGFKASREGKREKKRNPIANTESDFSKEYGPQVSSFQQGEKESPNLQSPTSFAREKNLGVCFSLCFLQHREKLVNPRCSKSLSLFFSKKFLSTSRGQRKLLGMVFLSLRFKEMQEKTEV